MIYVDDFRGRFRQMVMCHMMSDQSVEELHEFAGRLGLRREWYQDGSAPHYDVCLSMRAKALRMGAVDLSTRSPEWRRVYRMKADGLVAPSTCCEGVEGDDMIDLSDRCLMVHYVRDHRGEVSTSEIVKLQEIGKGLGC